MERSFRRSWLAYILLLTLWMNGVYLFPPRGLPSAARGYYPEGPLGAATLVFMRFALPTLICVGAWSLIRRAQRAAYTRFTRPERLMEFLKFGRCPACLHDLLGVEPDPADGCRVCRNCGGAWRLATDPRQRNSIGCGAEYH